LKYQHSSTIEPYFATTIEALTAKMKRFYK